MGDLWGAFVIAEADGPQTGHELLGVDQGTVAIGHTAACRHQCLHGGGKLFERGMAGRGGDPGGGTGTEHLRLEVGDFDEGVFDAILDRADLGGDLKSGILDDLLAHDFSLPIAPSAPELAGRRAESLP